MTKRQFKMASLAGAMALVMATGVNAEVRWSGVINAGVAVSDVSGTTTDDDGNTVPVKYIDRIYDKANFGDTSFGLNVSADIGHKWSVAAQLFAHGGHETIDFDWGFATYQATDEVAFRAGRIKYPGNLVSEYVDVGYAYPWIRPPQELYGHLEVGAAMTLEAINGGSIEYVGMGDEWEWSIMGYVGEADEETMDHKQMHAARFLLSNDEFKFLLGANRSFMEQPGMALMHEKWMTVLSAGFQMDWNNIMGYAEYVTSDTEDVDDLSTNAWYVTGGYHFGSVTPHLTYTELKQDSGIEQNTWTLGLRWDMAPSTAFKVEYQQIDAQAARSDAPAMTRGRAGLFNGVPDKMPVNMFSLALNFVF